MDSVSKSIAHSLESGEYFRDALFWYRKKYLHPHFQRFFLAWICMAMLVATVLSLSCLNSLFPLVRSAGFVTFSQKTIGHTPLIAPIEGGERESAFRLVARYLLKAYVVKRESYKFSELALQDVYIQNTSSKPVYTQFNDTMQPDSPTSPARLYQWAYDQKVNITAVNFIGSDDAPERAVVSFTTKLVDENDNFIKESKAVANIAFTMPLIEDMMSKKANMAFQVRSYHVNVLE